MPSAGCGQSKLTGVHCYEQDGRNEVGTMTEDIIFATKIESKSCDRPVPDVDNKIETDVRSKPVVVSMQTDTNLNAISRDNVAKQMIDLPKLEQNEISNKAIESQYTTSAC